MCVIVTKARYIKGDIHTVTHSLLCVKHALG